MSLAISFILFFLFFFPVSPWLYLGWNPAWWVLEDVSTASSQKQMQIWPWQLWAVIKGSTQMPTARKQQFALSEDADCFRGYWEDMAPMGTLQLIPLCRYMHPLNVLLSPSTVCKSAECCIKPSWGKNQKERSLECPRACSQDSMCSCLPLFLFDLLSAS